MHNILQLAFLHKQKILQMLLKQFTELCLLLFNENSVSLYGCANISLTSWGCILKQDRRKLIEEVLGIISRGTRETCGGRHGDTEQQEIKPGLTGDSGVGWKSVCACVCVCVLGRSTLTSQMMDRSPFQVIWTKTSIDLKQGRNTVKSVLQMSPLSGIYRMYQKRVRVRSRRTVNWLLHLW